MNALAAVLTSNAPRSGSGFIGGGQFGYNYQFASAYVLGFEADIQALQDPAEPLALLRPRPLRPSVFWPIIMGRPPRSRSASIIWGPRAGE